MPDTQEITGNAQQPQVVNQVVVAKPAEMSKRSLYTLVSGTVGAVAGYLGTKLGLNSRLAEFENAVDVATKQTITGRGGLGAAVSETGGFLGGGASLAPGLATGEVYRANYGQLARSGKYGKLPKVMFDTFRTEGVQVLSAAGAVAAGTVAAVATYNAMKTEPKAEAQADGDWAQKVTTEPKGTGRNVP